MDEHEAQVLADVDRFGWSVMKVSNDLGPDFAYSAGIYRTLGHPEIILFGLPLEIMHRLINDVGDRVRTGARYVAGQTSDEFLEGYPVTFRAVPTAHYRGHLGWATWLMAARRTPCCRWCIPTESIAGRGRMACPRGFGRDSPSWRTSARRRGRRQRPNGRCS